MDLNEASLYIAKKFYDNPYEYQKKYWKSRLVFAFMRGNLSDTPTQEEVENWLENTASRQRVTIQFDRDLHEKLQERFRGKYGEMSDFVNKVVREAL